MAVSLLSKRLSKLGPVDTFSRFKNTGRSLLLRPSDSTKASKMPSSDMKQFKEIFNNSKRIVVLTGAGVSAESGIPTFRGAGGLWRQYKAQDLATPSAFASNPSLVWEFYHHRRDVVFSKQPNLAHKTIAETQKRLKTANKKLSVITQNVDGFHSSVGTEDVIELHGSLFKTRCTKCSLVETNLDSPICPGLAGKGEPDVDSKSSKIPLANLPSCKSCGGLLRPHIIWFGEGLDPQVLDRAEKELESCDLCLVVGTSSVVYPAAMFAPAVAARGVPVAEFNLESTPETENFGFHFEGPCTKTVPEALGMDS